MQKSRVPRQTPFRNPKMSYRIMSHGPGDGTKNFCQTGWSGVHPGSTPSGETWLRFRLGKCPMANAQGPRNLQGPNPNRRATGLLVVEGDSGVCSQLFTSDTFVTELE